MNKSERRGIAISVIREEFGISVEEFSGLFNCLDANSIRSIEHDGFGNGFGYSFDNVIVPLLRFVHRVRGKKRRIFDIDESEECGQCLSNKRKTIYVDENVEISWCRDCGSIGVYAGQFDSEEFADFSETSNIGDILSDVRSMIGDNIDPFIESIKELKLKLNGASDNKTMLP